MDLGGLEIFRAVAAERSVTRAAERLGRVQSNVTTRVRQLEDDLRVPLFLRDGKRMTLTPEGRRLLDYANRLLALAEEARQAMHPQVPQGRLRVGTMESTAASRLPGPLARFHQRWPEVALELATGPTRRLLDKVLAHELDCAFVAMPPGGEPLDAALEGSPVFAEQLRLVLPASHPPVKTAADLQVATLAAFDGGCTYRRLGEQWLAEGGRSLRVLELGSYHAILACVAAGTSLGVAPQSVLDLQRTPGDVRSVPLCEVETVLVRRQGYAAAAFGALQKVLCEGG